MHSKQLKGGRFIRVHSLRGFSLFLSGSIVLRPLSRKKHYGRIRGTHLLVVRKQKERRSMLQNVLCKGMLPVTDFLQPCPNSCSILPSNNPVGYDIISGLIHWLGLSSRDLVISPSLNVAWGEQAFSTWACFGGYIVSKSWHHLSISLFEGGYVTLYRIGRWEVQK